MTRAHDTFEKVLVVDDSPAIRALAESILRQGGYDVSVAASGADAMEWIRAQLPDLVLLDLSLPDLEGARVCELLKSDSSLRGIFILILLNTNEIKRQKELKALGADGFVVKPFIPKDLINQVESLLDRGEDVEAKEKSVSDRKPGESKSTPGKPRTYEWFVSEIKKDGEDEPVSTSPGNEPSRTEEDSPEEDKMEYEAKQVDSQKDGYENFVSQFKEEIKASGPGGTLAYGELRTNDETDSTTKIKTLKHQSFMKSQDKEVSLDPERITKELIHEVASKVAREVVENLDKETLKNLIRKKIEEFRV